MNQALLQRNLETSVETFTKSRKHTVNATGSNKWWEDRITHEPVNQSIFQNMHNNKYLAVSGQAGDSSGCCRPLLNSLKSNSRPSFSSGSPSFQRKIRR